EDIDSLTISYSSKELSKSPAASRPPSRTIEPGLYRIVRASDTLQTGNDVAPGAPTPDGNREWFFPRGAMVHVVGHEGPYCKIDLEKNVIAWVADSNVERAGERTLLAHLPGGIYPAKEYIDLMFPASHNPFKITPENISLRVHIYGQTQPGLFNTSATDPLINNIG